MTLDPGFVQALEDRIVNAVVTRITHELNKKEKVFTDQCKTLFTGSETMLYFEPVHTMLKQIVESQSSLIEKVDKIDNMFASISEQLQKKRMSIVDFQLGETPKAQEALLDVVKEGFKITDMRGSPVVVRTEVHAENMQSLMDKGDTETTSDLSGNTTPVPTSSLQVDMTSVKEPIGYSMLDLSDDLKDFNICYQFHNFDLIMNEYGSTTLVVKDGEIDIQSVKQLLDNYISVNAIHTEPSVNSWMIDIRFLSIRKENKLYSLTGFKDFINLLMLDIKAATLAPEPQKPMTLLDLFRVHKRADLDSIGTFFNPFYVNFDKNKSHFVISKNVTVVVRAVDVIKCFNKVIETGSSNETFEYPVVLEKKIGSATHFIKLCSVKQFTEWLLVE